MENRKYFKNKKITIPVQKYNLRKRYKNMIVKDYDGIGLKMLIKVQPTKLSKFYYVLIEYKSEQTTPKVYISVEQLNVDNYDIIPHKYGIETIKGKEYVNLCLYYKNEWNAGMNISDTIIPWICEWLYFFEYWSITGEWCGGGKHP